ncbi:hypothetical protein NM208_g14534 [Fusarium decemcellulare]|uniref:Uncharacterized protein n=1 Tax=Fusarium decemcellulare TaxID=57161 RepID=A0ACC1RHI8_9HYPO|nr:hypothetical protein NM208_g14534 [Fusarium decemcellulare]
MNSQFPSYNALPPVPDMPQGCAWAVFNKGAKKDVYGCLNKITSDVIVHAASEVKDGVSISLKLVNALGACAAPNLRFHSWPMGAVKRPAMLRKGLVHKVTSFLDTPLGVHGFDDEVRMRMMAVTARRSPRQIEFNTQSSSQWDSLCHFHYQGQRCGYNGVRPSADDLVQNFGDEDKEQKFPTINHWHSKGCLVTRGVLIDYKMYAERHKMEYSPFESRVITVGDIEAIAREQRVSFRQGDVIIIRTGFTAALGGATDEEQQEMLGTQRSVGVAQSPETVEWFWNKHFAAVAADNAGFEVLPPLVNGQNVGTTQDMLLHQTFLGLFGLPIGELWDLEALSQYCTLHGRYTFLLTSSPLNVAGAVASPPNAIAIF